MIEVKVGCSYVTNSGNVVKIVSDDGDTACPGFITTDGYIYNQHGYLFGYEYDEEPRRIIKEVAFNLTHTDIQLLRNTLVERLNNLEFLIQDNKELSQTYYKSATPDSEWGIEAFHELNKCKDSIRYCKKERKRIAELLRKLKKQQAEILRNTAKV